jgi:hypothetical protein
MGQMSRIHQEIKEFVQRGCNPDEISRRMHIDIAIVLQVYDSIKQRLRHPI